jgi:hypothetical protein
MEQVTCFFVNKNPHERDLRLCFLFKNSLHISTRETDFGERDKTAKSAGLTYGNMRRMCLLVFGLIFVVKIATCRWIFGVGERRRTVVLFARRRVIALDARCHGYRYELLVRHRLPRRPCIRNWRWRPPLARPPL